MFLKISKNRNTLMGISALLITVHHYFTAVMEKPFRFGAIGVDIFVFLMGFGLYFSLYNSEKNDNLSSYKMLISFYKRRLKRIVPVFFVFLVFWGIWKHYNGGFDLKDFFLNLSFFGYWSLPYGKYFNWFISAIFFFYVLAPFIYFLLSKIKNKIIVTFSLFLLISGVVFLLKKNDNGEIHRTLIMVVRVIPFLFGMYFGCCCKENPCKRRRILLLTIFSILFIAGIVLYLINNFYWNDNGFTYGMPWYSFGLMTPFLCIIFSYVLEWFDNIRIKVGLFFDFIGKMSFEVYLTHIFVIENLMPVLKTKEKLWFVEPYNFLASVFVSFLFAYILWLFGENVKRKFSSMKLSN